MKKEEQIKPLKLKEVIKGQEKKHKLPTIFPILGIINTIFLFYLIGVVGLFVGILAIAFGTVCYEWSIEIKKNKTIAFLIGLLFGLFGVIAYFIYYKISQHLEDD